MIELTWKLLQVAGDGTITADRWIDSSIIRRADFDETVGDEFFCKSSDLIIESIGELPQLFSLPVKQNWLACYVNGLLFNVYRHPQNADTGDLDYLEHDEKTDRYKFRLYPLQKVFYDHLAATVLQYSSTSTEWNYDLDLAIISIHQIATTNEIGGVETSTIGRAGFSLGDMIISLIGKDNDYGYVISGLNHPILLYNSSDLPILFRGQSIDDGETAENIVNFTFYENGGDIFHVTWMDIFKLIIFGWNAFIRVQPTIISSKLGIDVSIIPKIAADIGFTISAVQWIERRRVREKYKLDGVKLDGKNFSYEQGSASGNVLSRSVDIADYNQPIDNNDKTLYWAEGDFDSGDSDYDLVSPYFASGKVQAWYENMITTGDGFEGKAFLNYFAGAPPQENLLTALSQIAIGDETIQLNTLRFDATGVADIEGIIIVN